MSGKMTLTSNREIREKLQKNRITLWRLADALETSETALCRKMRHELGETDKERIMNALDGIIKASV